ncbi:MAG: hypothetical protein AABY22_35345 [Nanoarchaeota archaeon]
MKCFICGLECKNIEGNWVCILHGIIEESEFPQDDSDMDRGYIG